MVYGILGQLYIHYVYLLVNVRVASERLMRSVWTDLGEILANCVLVIALLCYFAIYPWDSVRIGL